MSRRPVTTKTRICDLAIDLFDRNGFDETSVDDIAAAAGIARRTLFRYYPSKNAIAWGDFDVHLEDMRTFLDTLPGDMPLTEALAAALIDFNDVPAAQTARHRRRMRLLLTIPALQAHSMIMYADWRHTVAGYIGARLGVPADGYLPQLISWLTLSTALAAYEQWLDDSHDPSAQRLRDLLLEGSGVLANGIDGALALAPVDTLN
ncbi:mycofactocin system transcriptional regulator [Gordonia crocea]|uniref:Putative transcriptional regulatory protein TetR n=1 Tax=Gordonia crocea TaxID=589162 RepID=A0A7I9V2D8_9ACTN|nr:mycofactocin system transcriptional regulator [Gordonia crocea]GED99376.1 putative transcriptional regulatory protein TetR [Gordonia crocea]